MYRPSASTYRDEGAHSTQRNLSHSSSYWRPPITFLVRHRPQSFSRPLLGTSFIGHFIRGIFSGELKVVPWRSQSVTVLFAAQKRIINVRGPIILQPATSTKKCVPSPFMDDPSTPAQSVTKHQVCLARQVTIPPGTTKMVVVTTKPPGLLTVVRRNLPTGQQLTIAARGMAEVLPKQPFHTIVSIFSNQPTHLPKHMVTAYTDTPPASIHYRRKHT